MKYLNAIAFTAVITVNILSNTLPFNGQTQQMISDRLRVLITPAGYTFSIWGLIYLLVFAFVVGAISRDRRRVRMVGPAFLVSCGANMGWLFAWHWNQPVLALGFMFLLLGSLITIKVRLGADPPRSSFDRWTADIPFEVYLGWISVATIVNVAVVLEYLDWNAMGINPETWTIAMMAVAVLLAFLALVAWGSAPFALVIAWALVGISVANPSIAGINWSGWIGAAVILALVVYTWVGRRGISRA
ncbi:MAG: tryptophan-rich sensory protein [Bacillota bacterium]